MNFYADFHIHEGLGAEFIVCYGQLMQEAALTLFTLLSQLRSRI